MSLVLDDGFERAGPPLVEVQPARQGLDAHLQVLHLDAKPGDLDDEVVDHLVEERVCLLTLTDPLVEVVVHPGLKRERMTDGVRIDEQFHEWTKELSNAAEPRSMRLIQRRVIEFVLRQLGRERAMPPELLDEIGPEAARVEKSLQLDGRQLLELGLRVVGAALLANAGANLPHDLLDVHRIGSDVEVGHIRS
jgi:hypothetical protein